MELIFSKAEPAEEILPVQAAAALTKDDVKEAVAETIEKLIEQGILYGTDKT